MPQEPVGGTCSKADRDSQSPPPAMVWRLMGRWSELMEIEGINCFDAVERAGKEKKGLD